MLLRANTFSFFEKSNLNLKSNASSWGAFTGSWVRHAGQPLTRSSSSLEALKSSNLGPKWVTEVSCDGLIQASPDQASPHWFRVTSLHPGQSAAPSAFTVQPASEPAGTNYPFFYN